MRRPIATRIVLPWLAVLAFLIVEIRACVQAVTIDEASTYEAFGGREFQFVWYPASDNHVLNSLGIWLFTSVFGLSHLSLRAPALIGAALYILASYAFARSLFRGVAAQSVLFVCLAYNPMILDFMVAARGYSLANGCLLCAIATTVLSHLHTPIREL